MTIQNSKMPWGELFAPDPDVDRALRCVVEEYRTRFIEVEKDYTRKIISLIDRAEAMEARIKELEDDRPEDCEHLRDDFGKCIRCGEQL